MVCGSPFGPIVDTNATPVESSNGVSSAGMSVLTNRIVLLGASMDPGGRASRSLLIIRRRASERPETPGPWR